jgi:lipopolysaccharide export system protein LptC
VNRLRLVLSIVFITAMGFMWLSLKDKPNEPQASVVNPGKQADYVAIDLNRIVFDANGKKTQALSAKKMTYFESENRAEFELPLLVLKSSQTNSKWQISANRGTLYQNDRLLLQSNVDAVNLTIGDMINRITSDNISVNIIDNTMMSNDPVNMYGEGVEITGAGLMANLNEQKIELIRHAKTIYQTVKK